MLSKIFSTTFIFLWTARSESAIKTHINDFSKDQSEFYIEVIYSISKFICTYVYTVYAKYKSDTFQNQKLLKKLLTSYLVLNGLVLDDASTLKVHNLFK